MSRILDCATESVTNAVTLVQMPPPETTSPTPDVAVVCTLESLSSGDGKPVAGMRSSSPTPSAYASQALPIQIGDNFHISVGEHVQNGKVIGGPEIVENRNSGRLQICWRVRYSDGAEEDLNANDLLRDNLIVRPFQKRMKDQNRYRLGVSMTENQEEPHHFEDTMTRLLSEASTASVPVSRAQKPIQRGYKFFKRFGFNDRMYQGHVISDFPEETVDGETKERVLSWRVKYDDDEEEDLTEQEIYELPTSNPVLEMQKRKKARLAAGGVFEMAKLNLLYTPGVSEEEADEALTAIGPPYGLQAAMHFIHEQRRQNKTLSKKEKFKIEFGMKVRRCAGGSQYRGEVTSEGKLMPSEFGGKIRMWEVTFEDGFIDDLGCSVVSQEFAERKWRVRSVDNDPRSMATDKVDFMKFELEDVGFYPDFLWASPPCFTYSLLAGDRHRIVGANQFEISEEAREHNFIFTRLIHMIQKALAKKPHMIFVIENPKAKLAEMPLMKQFESELGLHRATVDYCAFGRPDKKPTHLWTNDFDLCSRLNTFRCTKTTCPYESGHPVSARGNSNLYNMAVIPEALAEFVVRFVDAKMEMNHIRRTKNPPINVPVVAAPASISDNASSSS